MSWLLYLKVAKIVPKKAYGFESLTDYVVGWIRYGDAMCWRKGDEIVAECEERGYVRHCNARKREGRNTGRVCMGLSILSDVPLI